MKAMILAAGLGTRMRPLTDHTPKPLLQAGGQALIAYHLQQLQRAGIREVLINTHWLADQIERALGDGSQFGLSITYSYEPELLETAGGIAKALPFLSQGEAPFLLLNGDVYCELDLQRWLAQTRLAPEHLARLALVPNPVHHPGGDFCLDVASERLELPAEGSSQTFTYAGIALFRPAFFAGVQPVPTRLAPLLFEHIKARRVCGEVITDYWLDVGTPERLAELDARLRCGMGVASQTSLKR